MTTPTQDSLTDLLSDGTTTNSLMGNHVDIIPEAEMHHPGTESITEVHEQGTDLGETHHQTSSTMGTMLEHSTVMEAIHHHDNGQSAHPNNPLLHGEHLRLLSLTPYPEHNVPGDNNFVAVNDGSWFDPNTWEHGEIPTDDGRVFIARGVHVTYDQESDARIYTLRVDGTIEFSTDQDTKLLVDTFLVAPTGLLEIGTEEEAVQAGVQTQIIFTSDQAIDTTWDTTQLSRGLLSHGQVSIHGAEKLEYASLVGNAEAGDNYLEVALEAGQTSPAGWRVGDKIVLGGTYYSNNGSDEDNSRFHDEELTIERIVGNRVYFTNDDTGGNRLRFDHTIPEGHDAHDLKLYVANLTRNVSFSTENGKEVPIGHRGHVMFMHNPNVVVENAGFYDLGRTNKLELIDAVGTNVDGTPGNGTNVRGRYALHFHRTGADSWEGQPAIARGNAVSGSPGWGIVHHDSYAILEDNVVFDVVGSGIAAEAGNEIGAWRNNLTIKTIGNGDNVVRPDLGPRNVLHDFGYEGEGYWVQGAAQIALVDNKAVSAAGGGINIFSNAIGGRDFREVSTISVDVLPEELQAIVRQEGLTEIDVANVPLLRLSGFETYNSTTGIFFWQHLGNNDGQLGFNGPGTQPAHELRSRVDDFKIWNAVKDGVHFQYSTQIDLENGLILGNPTRIAGRGISSNRPSQNLTFKGLHIEGFRDGFFVPREGDIGESTPLLGSRIEDSTFVNNRTHLSSRFSRERDPNRTDLFPDYFEIVNTTFSDAENNTAPMAAFDSQAEGGLGVSFDASASYDPDVPESNGESMLAIAAYGWDYNNDGVVDEFGRTVSHKFDSAGEKTVSLTVWDTQGASQTTTQTINVEESDFVDPIADGAFTETTQEDFTVRSKYQSSLGINLGWNSNGWILDESIGNGGAAVAVDPKRALGQVIYDDYIRTGQQTLTLDLKNIEGDDRANEITARVWGVNGQFRQRGWQARGPEAEGALPFESVLLLEETIGGANYDWNTFQWNADFQQGYQFLVFQVDADGFNGASGDYIAVDNIHLYFDGKPLTFLAEASTPVEPQSPTQEPSTPTEEESQTIAKTSPTVEISEIIFEDQNLKGTMSQDTLVGSVGNDTLNGRGHRDRLIGDDGHDKLQGGGGHDTLLGGQGRDTLVGGNGFDILTGNDDRDFLIGGNGDDQLMGGAGADQLLGGRGSDTLEGGEGRDRFRWTRATDFADTVVDFDGTEDRLQFKAAALNSDLSRGFLDDSQLTMGLSATATTDRFIYDDNSGRLFFDADGTGAQAQVHVATFSNKASLSANVIQIL